jgi:catechol 2,3-dioxygenase-like lactoylglutathione lyase family enzyme
MPAFHVGRLIDHVHLRCADLKATHRFYAAVMQAIGIPAGRLTDYSYQVDELYISPIDPSEGIAPTHVHLAFQAKDRETVVRFYEAAMANGGKNNGLPGERDYHPGYYAAFVLDPDGNNIEAVYHGPAKRSAVSIALTPID